MKKIFPFLLAFLIFVPLTASAALPGFGQIVPEVCKTCPCGWGGVMAIIQNVVNFIIALSVIFATIIIVWAGGLYIISPTNPESRSTANKMLINAFIGLLIVLSAWLIVDFVMKTLYGGQFGPWNSILTGSGAGNSCVVAKSTSALFTGNIVAVPGQGINPGTGGGGGGVISGATAQHAAAVAYLRTKGISVSSSGNCSDRTNPSCTSLEGMREDTINQAVILKEQCGSSCTVTVTGGTETGHSSGHTNGYKIDLALNNALNSYIQGMRTGGQRSNGDLIYYDKCGNEYVKEGDHWDINVNRGLCREPK